MTVSTAVGRGRQKGSTNKPNKVLGQKDIRNLFNQPSLPTQRDAGEGSSAQVFTQEQLSDPVEESSRSDLNNTIPVPNAFDDAYSSDASGDEDIFINGEDFPEWLPDKIVLDDEIAGQEQEDSVVFDYLQRLKAKIKRNVMPDEYKRGTLWVNPPSPCFALKGEADPTSLYLPRVCLWFPHHLTQEKLKCPTCGSSLESKGIATDPTARKIIDIDDCFYIMTYRYECTSESLLHQQSGPNKSLRSFRGYNEAIMNQLPFRVQAEFPACLSKKSGISVMLLNMLRPFVQNSVGPVRLSKILRELHMLRYDKVKLQYLDAAVYRTKNPTLNMMAQTHWKFPKFSEFQDPKKYAGAFSSASYLKYMYTFTMKFFKPLIDAEMLKLGESTPTSSETDYRLRHNADVGRKNRYGKLYKNHYNPWTTQVINHLEESLGMPSNASYFDPYCDALKFRGNDVSSAKLSFGICPFPTDLMEQLQMHAFTFSSMPDNHVAKVVLPNERLLSDERALITATFLPFVFARRCPLNQYEFLALCLGTKYAVTPVHTEQEKTLYHELISQLAATSNRRNPNFLEMSQLWTSRCDGVGIFYKSPELLKSYYNITEERSVAKASIHANYASIKEIREVVASSNRPPAVVPTEHTYQRLENAESVYAVRINNQPSLQPSTTASSSSTSTVLPGSVAPQRRFRPIVADPSLELHLLQRKLVLQELASVAEIQIYYPNVYGDTFDYIFSVKSGYEAKRSECHSTIVKSLKAMGFLPPDQQNVKLDFIFFHLATSNDGLICEDKPTEKESSKDRKKVEDLRQKSLQYWQHMLPFDECIHHLTAVSCQFSRLKVKICGTKLIDGVTVHTTLKEATIPMEENDGASWAEYLSTIISLVRLVTHNLDIIRLMTDVAKEDDIAFASTSSIMDNQFREDSPESIDRSDSRETESNTTTSDSNMNWIDRERKLRTLEKIDVALTKYNEENDSLYVKGIAI